MELTIDEKTGVYIGLVEILEDGIENFRKEERSLTHGSMSVGRRDRRHDDQMTKSCSKRSTTDQFFGGFSERLEHATFDFEGHRRPPAPDSVDSHNPHSTYLPPLLCTPAAYTTVSPPSIFHLLATASLGVIWWNRRRQNHRLSQYLNCMPLRAHCLLYFISAIPCGCFNEESLDFCGK